MNNRITSGPAEGLLFVAGLTFALGYLGMSIYALAAGIPRIPVVPICPTLTTCYPALPSSMLTLSVILIIGLWKLGGRAFLITVNAGLVFDLLGSFGDVHYYWGVAAFSLVVIGVCTYLMRPFRIKLTWWLPLFVTVMYLTSHAMLVTVDFRVIWGTYWWTEPVAEMAAWMMIWKTFDRVSGSGTAPQARTPQTA